jgi:ferredoxin
MPHVITRFCVRDGGCVTVCPVESIVPGKPEDKYPWFYIDPETCIDCGACISECPVKAIYPREEVPHSYVSDIPKVISMPSGIPGYDQVFDGYDYEGNPVHLEHTRILSAGEVVDLSPDIEANALFFSEGPGYEALKE